MNELWMRQVRAVVGIEFGKILFSRRSLPMMLLALMPVALTVLMLIASMLLGDDTTNGAFGLRRPGQVARVFATLYEFILRLVVFTGCVWIFTNLFRGEVLDRSLHYYFLAPIRRQVLVVGKFVAGWAASTALFCASTLASFLLLYSHSGPGELLRQLGQGATFRNLLAYVALTALACIGYGAVFLGVGLLVRNPIVPALILWMWELANPFLPGMLKKLSVVFYLQSLRPVAVAEGPFALIVDPVPAWLAVPGLLLFTAGVLALAAFRIRRMEVIYDSD